MRGLAEQLLLGRSKRGMFRAGRMRTWGLIVASILSSSGPTKRTLVGGVCKATLALMTCRESDPEACISFSGCRQSDRKATQGASTSMGAITLCRSPVYERAKRRAAMVALQTPVEEGTRHPRPLPCLVRSSVWRTECGPGQLVSKFRWVREGRKSGKLPERLRWTFPRGSHPATPRSRHQDRDLARSSVFPAVVHRDLTGVYTRGVSPGNGCG